MSHAAGTRMRPRHVVLLAACTLLACEPAPRNEPYAPPGAGSRRDPGPFVGTGAGATNPGTSLSNPSGQGPGNVEGSTRVNPNDSPIPAPANDPGGPPSSLKTEPNGTPGRAVPVPPPGTGGAGGFGGQPGLTPMR